MHPILLPKVYDELDERRMAARRRPQTPRTTRRFPPPVLRPAF
jgi:hypothetical protein